MELPKTNRRAFLKTTGQLLIGFNLFPLTFCTPANKEDTFPPYAGIPKRPHVDKDLIDSWIRLDADGHVTVLTGKQELGQGIRITLIQMAAEELEVDIKRCHIINGDTGQTANEGYTAGSNSVEGSGKAIRQAAAEAKFYLLNLAATQWETDVKSLSVKDGIISGNGKETTSYWELTQGGYHEAKITGEAPLKEPKNYQYVGKTYQRDDIRKLVKGESHFVHDLRLPDMVHARVVHPQNYKTKLKSFPRAEVAAMHGVLEVIVDGSFVAIVAEREYQAVRAWQMLRETAQWDDSTLSPIPTELSSKMQEKAEDPELVEESSNIRPKIQTAPIKLEATYFRPYNMHASTGPSCAIAEWKSEQLTVWSPTQGVYPLKNSLANLLDIPVESIRCIGTPGSGCYGHNGADDASAEAALIAMKFPNRPVRLQWMREDEHQWEPYGSAMILKIEAGMDANGKILAWNNDIWSDTHSTRPSGKGGHYISSRHLEKPFQFERGGFSGGSYRNAKPYYAIPDIQIQLHNYEGPLRTSALRGLGAYGNIFALESFIGELASEAQLDPFTFRIQNLEDKRAIEVLEKLKNVTGFKSGKIDNKGYGIAFAKYKNSASYFAVLAEVEVDREINTFRLNKLTGVIDSGQCINPDGLKNQTEGGMIQSASWTLLEEVLYDENGILSKDWSTYPILRTLETPIVEVHIIDRPEEPPLGAGEAAQGPVAAAIANAVFEATGTRVRNLPIKSEKIDWG